MEYVIPLCGLVIISCCTSILVPTRPPPANIGDGCFPSAARVKLDNGKSVRMSELQVGDLIQTGLHQLPLFIFTGLSKDIF